MHLVTNQAIGGRALTAFGAGVLCALLLPRVLLGVLGGVMLMVAGYMISKQYHKES